MWWLWWWFQLFSSCLVLLILVQLVRLLLSDCDLLLSVYARGKGRSLAALRGKVVWITGASSGIGEELAYSLAGLGSRLILSARRETELQRVLDNCKTKSPAEYKNDHMILCLDLNDCDSHAALTEQVIQRYGKVDYLVNNAGRLVIAPAMDTQLNAVRAVLDLNVIGTISLTKTLLPHMIPQHSGAIVVMSSVSGKQGVPGMSSYGASKHALQGYFNALRMEIADSGVKVLMICPGPVKTDLFNNAIHCCIEMTNGSYPEQDGATVTPLSVKRCVHLLVVAMANGISETWMMNQPLLLVSYIAQYLPFFHTWLLNFLGPVLLKAMFKKQKSREKSD